MEDKTRRHFFDLWFCYITAPIKEEKCKELPRKSKICNLLLLLNIAVSHWFTVSASCSSLNRCWKDSDPHFCGGDKIFQNIYFNSFLSFEPHDLCGHKVIKNLSFLKWRGRGFLEMTGMFVKIFYQLSIWGSRQLSQPRCKLQLAGSGQYLRHQFAIIN